MFPNCYMSGSSHIWIPTGNSRANWLSTNSSDPMPEGVAHEYEYACGCGDYKWSYENPNQVDLNDPTAFHHKPIPMDELIILEPMNKDNFLPSEEEKILIRRLQAWENEPPNPYYRMR